MLQVQIRLVDLLVDSLVDWRAAALTGWRQVAVVPGLLADAPVCPSGPAVASGVSGQTGGHVRPGPLLESHQLRIQGQVVQQTAVPIYRQRMAPGAVRRRRLSARWARLRGHG